MVNKLIVDGLNITLSESTVLPFTYTFSTAGIHKVQIGLDDTEEICAYAFKDCADLTKVKLPSKITMIKRNAFENCESLKSFDIPKTIKYVGPNVFDGCSSLAEINFEDTVPPKFLTNLTEDTTCYIPDGSKFVLASELVKDGSVKYYEKNALGGYDEVDYEALEDGNEYYYDNWVDVHSHLNVVEQRFKNRPIEIGFYDGEAKGTEMRKEQGSTNVELFEHRFVPENTTNTNVFYISDNPGLVEVDQTGHINIAKNVSGRANIYICTEPFYDNSYVASSLRVVVLNETGIQKTDPNISFNVSNVEITDAENYTLPEITNEDNLVLIWTSSDESVAIVNSNGEIEIIGNGTTTIKARFNGNDVLKAKEISYELVINIEIEEPTETETETNTETQTETETETQTQTETETETNTETETDTQEEPNDHLVVEYTSDENGDIQLYNPSLDENLQIDYIADDQGDIQIYNQE